MDTRSINIYNIYAMRYTFETYTLNFSFLFSFEGDKTRGMYEGEGYALFTGGHAYKVLYIILYMVIVYYTPTK
jgi:hypothetical protein